MNLQYSKTQAFDQNFQMQFDSLACTCTIIENLS